VRCGRSWTAPGTAEKAPLKTRKQDSTTVQNLDASSLAALDAMLAPRDPGMALCQRMRARILADAARPRTQVLRAAEGVWKPLVPGIVIKTLRRDERAGTQTSLWRIDPGAAVPPHPHTQEEECLVLEGSITHDGIEYFPGDFLLAPRGERHKAFLAPRGALLLIRSELIPDPARLAAVQSSPR